MCYIFCVFLMLELQNLSVSVNEVEVLKDLSFSVQPGEVHAIMGPNGVGKSTLAHFISGRPGYELVNGSAKFMDKNLNSMNTEVRALEGIFLCFQNPVEIPGVSSMNFLRASFNSVRKFSGKDPINSADFIKLVRKKCDLLSIEYEILKRSVNVGFSGGEKKMFEALQILLLEPKLIILDEADSGLDVDALRRFVNNVNLTRNSKNSWIIITHYCKLFDYIKPDKIHILSKGTISRSGGLEIASIIENHGYSFEESNAS